MNACVLDCSAALCWILPDEGDAATDALLDQVAEAGVAGAGLDGDPGPR